MRQRNSEAAMSSQRLSIVGRDMGEVFSLARDYAIDHELNYHVPPDMWYDLHATRSIYPMWEVTYVVEQSLFVMLEKQ